MRLVILGAGGYGKTIADLAEQSGQYESIQMLDDAGETPCAEFAEYMVEARSSIRRLVTMRLACAG